MGMLLQLEKHKEKSRMHSCDSPTPVSTIGAGSSGTSATFALQICRACNSSSVLFIDKTTSIPFSSLVKLHIQPHPNKAQSWAQPRWHLGFEAQEFFVLNVIGSFCASMTLMTLTIWETISCLEWEAIPQIRSCHKEDDISFLTCTFPATDSLRSPPNG